MTFESGVLGVTMLTVVADDNDRKAYLNRAKALLKQELPGPLATSSSSRPAIRRG